MTTEIVELTNPREINLAELTTQEIKSPDDYIIACEAIRVIKERLAQIESEVGPDIATACRLHKALTAARKLQTVKLDALDDILRMRVAQYHDAHALEASYQMPVGVGFRDAVTIDVTDLPALLAYLLARGGDLLDLVKVDTRELAARAKRQGAVFSMPGVAVINRSIVAVFAEATK